MLGAIIGDIVGSPYEFANTHDRDFPLFGNNCDFTDDTICTVAVADALVSGKHFRDAIREWCRRYPHPKGSYGGSFSAWLRSTNAHPYGSWGNGAAMRVSPCGWAFDSEAVTLRAALASAAVTHNHVEGLIGASTVARAIFMLRLDRALTFSSPKIVNLIVSNYGEGWEDRVPATGVFDESSHGCVPLAFLICMKADGFVDAVRRAVLYGGDTDTVGAIVGSLAEARWGIPSEVADKALSMLPNEMRTVINEFQACFDYEY